MARQTSARKHLEKNTKIFFSIFVFFSNAPRPEVAQNKKNAATRQAIYLFLYWKHETGSEPDNTIHFSGAF